MDKINFDEFGRECFGSRWVGLRKSLELKDRKAQVLLRPHGITSHALPFYNYANCWQGVSSFKSCSEQHAYFLDGASVAVSALLDVRAGDHVLDMCAAPGGKSLFWLLQSHVTLEKWLANEVSTKRRLRMLKVFQQFLGSSEQFPAVKGSDGRRYCLYYPSFFDRILCDVPCSSESHLIKQGEIHNWSLKNSKKNAATQWALLSSAFYSLKVGGRIVYSTCSISPLENEGVVKKLFDKHGDKLKKITFSLPWAQQEYCGDCHIFPDEHSGMGPLYVAVMEKVAPTL